MKFDQRIAIKIAGEAGMGVDSTGAIVMKALKNLGYYIYGEREFASIIKGLNSSLQIEVSKRKVRAKTQQADIAVAIDREGLRDALKSVVDGGVIIHGFTHWNKVIKDLPQQAEARNISVHQIPARDIAEENGGGIIMVNVILLGYLWKVLGLKIESLHKQIEQQFSKKPKLLPINYTCSQAGYDYEVEDASALEVPLTRLEGGLDTHKRMVIDGNNAIVLGAIQAGVRAYYAYPMSPSSSILTGMANAAKDFGLVVKQAEDEITVAQLTLGSMHTGTRAMCATSGGGYDLMTETVSLSGMIETPWVCVVAQRPGPATGLPTWTAQGDLNLAVNAAHGEFSRCVIAVSDAESGFELIQHALNIAEEYQIPVTVLTEAVIGMSYSLEQKFDAKVEIKRGLVADKDLEGLESEDRFANTESGISKRWLPGTSETIYYANGDEHAPDGSITEEAELVREGITKRIRKMDVLKKSLPEPVVHGSNRSKLGIIGWGSTKNVVLDVQDILEKEGVKFDYLHVEYMWPLRTETIEKFMEKHDKVMIMEGNATGQFAQLLKGQCGLEPDELWLKWDGRPFYVEEVIEKIKGLF
jgi:2-oxoglutarate ferredoxin oxidoreductase subunit alpha